MPLFGAQVWFVFAENIFTTCTFQESISPLKLEVTTSFCHHMRDRNTSVFEYKMDM